MLAEHPREQPTTFIVCYIHLTTRSKQKILQSLRSKLFLDDPETPVFQVFYFLVCSKKIEAY